MSESATTLPAFGGLEASLLRVVLLAAALALAYGWYLRYKVLRHDTGPEAMGDVARAIQEGAMAYLGQQRRVMAPFVLAVFLGLYLLYRPIYTTRPALAAGVAGAFLLGCVASYGAGFVGMTSAVQGNVRVASAARRSYREALRIAFEAGTISGMFTVGLGLLGATIIFLLFREDATKVLVGFGFGGSLVAAFMRVGGGIYTKAADVGADLVGKVEIGIPEDDPRNAAVIADNVGDNVGDCAGMAADVFESYEVTLVAAIILGAATLLDPAFVALYGAAAGAFALKLIIYPLLVRAIGVVASVAGTWSVRGKDEEIGDPMRPINVGFYVSIAVSVVGFGAVTYLYLRDPATGAPDWRFFLATLTGILLALVIGRLTELFTHPAHGAVSEIAESTRTGAATMLLSGMGFGLESTVWAITAIGLTIAASMAIFAGNAALAAYGIALAGLGLLTTTGYILAMDTYGPIVDNANGIFEMSGVERGDSLTGRIVARLDAVGNTTKALTKGFAIATAVVAAIALFRSFVDEARLVVPAEDLVRGGAQLLGRVGIQVNLPEVFIGLLLGGAVPFLVSAFLIRAVGRSAFSVVEEVRRQFREIPGLLEGRGRPDYSRCVAIVTRGAQRELLSPAMISVGVPVLVGFGLGAAALGGYLAGAILTAQLLAVYMANTGAAWDNAKKRIEDGYLGGKGTEYHKAAVIGDTVGDPLKDTAGPALNPLIKVMNLVAILIAPVVIQPLTPSVRRLVVLGTLALVAGAVALSRRRPARPAEVPGEPAPEGRLG